MRPSLMGDFGTLYANAAAASGVPCFEMRTIETPVGPMTIVVDGEGRLTELRFGSERFSSPVSNPVANPAIERVARQLMAYFAGTSKSFELELAPRGTPFQLAVWNELRNIPWGETISYAELARRIGKPDAVRAVGSANGANPIPIVVPCHRVIGSNGSLTGYGGGIEKKQWLLALEGARLF